MPERFEIVERRFSHSGAGSRRLSARATDVSGRRREHCKNHRAPSQTVWVDARGWGQVADRVRVLAIAFHRARARRPAKRSGPAVSDSRSCTRMARSPTPKRIVCEYSPRPNYGWAVRWCRGCRWCCQRLRRDSPATIRTSGRRPKPSWYPPHHGRVPRPVFPVPPGEGGRVPSELNRPGWADQS